MRKFKILNSKYSISQFTKKFNFYHFIPILIATTEIKLHIWRSGCAQDFTFSTKRLRKITILPSYFGS